MAAPATADAFMNPRREGLVDMDKLRLRWNERKRPPVVTGGLCGLLLLVLEQPGVQLVGAVGLVPGVVPDPGVLGVLRVPAGLLQRLDDVAGHLHGNGGVGGPVEAPARDVLDLLGRLLDRLLVLGVLGLGEPDAAADR